MTHFDEALAIWQRMQLDPLRFGRAAKQAIETEGRTIRDFSVALCGNASLEDKIGRYIMAAEFYNSLPSATCGIVMDWLTPSHYTELAKIEQATDRDTALDYMQDLITELPDGRVDVKPVEWLRAKRSGTETTSASRYHRLWMIAAKAINDAISDLERLGNLATRDDRRRVRVLKLVIRLFQAEKERE